MADETTFLRVIDLWYDLARGSPLDADQLLALRDALREQAGRFDGTLALLKAQTAIAVELEQICQAQRHIIMGLESEVADLKRRYGLALFD
jgi:hypothetical protein